MPHRNVWKTAYLEPIQSIKQASHQGQAQHRLQTVKVLGRKGPVMQCTLQRHFCQKLSLTSSNNDPKNN